MESPLRALEWVQQGGEFDVALLDMQMPDMDGIMLAGELRKVGNVAGRPLVMLTSLGRKEARAALVDFAAYLYKPIRLSQLHNVLMEILARLPETSAHHLDASSSRIDATLATRVPLRILLAEDHPVNQRLALQILGKMGYRTDLAANGEEVLQAVERQPYDVILMDVQMPKMDGLEATRQICARWAKENRPAIIAMTAEAMAGDREKCLAAGMDDYISKPIRIPQLVAALSKCRARLDGAEPARPSPEASGPVDAAPRLLSDLPTLDAEVIAEMRTLQVEGQPDFVSEMQALFLQETPPLLEAIRAAVTGSDAEALRRAAHTLKGNGNSMGAKRLGGLCLELEKVGKGGSVLGAQPFLNELEAEFTHVRDAFNSGTKGQPL
jgi:CheY-like chemotaxis protein